MNKKLIITRGNPPVTKTVERCHQCPWVRTEPTGYITLPFCDNPHFNAGQPGRANIIGDIVMHSDGISKYCPERDQTDQ